MKKFAASLLICFCILPRLHAQSFTFDSIGYRGLQVGQVMLDDETWLIRVERGLYPEYFMPVNLPDRYKIKGQDVVFEGAIGRIPMDQKLPGTPISLSMIRILYTAKPNGSQGENVVTEDRAITGNADSIGYLHNVEGSIHLVGDTYIIEMKNEGETTRYVPDFLPDEFKKDNIEITFSAVLKKIPQGVKMMGAPVSIRELMMVENIELTPDEMQESIRPYFPFDSAGYQPLVRGVIRSIQSDPEQFIIEINSDNNSITRYFPIAIPEEFKKDGVEVNFSGTIGKIPPNVRLMGTPITIHDISLADD